MPASFATGFRVSPQQKRVWMLQQAEEDQPYRARCSVRIDGQLSTADLQAAITHVVEQHEILRTNFRCRPGLRIPVQIISEDRISPLREYDLRNLSAPEQTARIEELFDTFGRQPVGLEDGPLLQIAIAVCSDIAHTLFIDLPALCADVLTLTNLVREIADRYAFERGVPAGDGRATPIQYADISEVFNDLLESEEMQTGREYWQQQNLSALFSQQFLYVDPRAPEDAPRPYTPRFAPRRHSCRVQPEIAAQIERLTQHDDIALPAFYLACWSVLLARLTGQSEVLIGTAYDGRVYEGLDTALGLFMRYLPLRSTVHESGSVAHFVRQVDRSLMALVAWQEYFSLEIGTGAGSEPFMPFGFSFAALPAAYLTTGASFAIDRCDAVVDRFNLQLICVHQDGGLTTEFHYDSNVYPAAFVQRLAAQYHALVRAASSHSAALRDLALLSDEEQQHLLVDLNATTAPFPHDQCLHQMFQAQVERTPAQPAVIFGGRHYTYAELDARANQLAHHLRACGVGPEARVGLYLARGIDMLVGLLGVLKAGGAYVPLDLAYPQKRLQFILKQAAAHVVLTQADLRDRLACQQQAQPDRVQIICLDTDWKQIARLPQTAPINTAGPENLAYIIHTSGSTGWPKGVMIQHRSVVNLATALYRAIYKERGPALRVSLNAPITFDGSVKQLAQLLYGHTLVILPEEVRPDGAKLLDFVRRNSLDVLDCTPSQLRSLLAAGFARGQAEERRSGDPRLVLFGGEGIDETTWKQLAGVPDTTWVNLYGPTECTVDATSGFVRETSAQPTIGRPIANVQVYLLDAELRPVPTGLPGELYIGGAGVARGYLDRPDLTAERFVPNPFLKIEDRGLKIEDSRADASEMQSSILYPLSSESDRLYRTGDLARHLPDGQLQFLGRVDQQVKVRGVRIELGEIEAVLREHPAIDDVAVALCQIDSAAGAPQAEEERQLVGYLVLRTDYGGLREADADTLSSAQALALNDIRSFLRERLPTYMVPGSFVVLASLPLTTHGKVDRQALPAPQPHVVAHVSYDAPRNHAEQTIAAIWADVLQVERVGINANFFDLGGHSLLMVQVFDRVQEAFQRELSVVDMFRHPTVSALAQYLGQDQAPETAQQTVNERAQRQKAAGERQQQLIKQGRGGH